MLTTLTLKRAPSPVRAPEAWLLPGGEAAAWLEEVATWPVPADAVGFYLLAGTDGTNPVGALAVPPPGTRVPPGGRALPYGQAVPGVFLPVDAVAWPPLAAEEWSAMRRSPVLVFHPALGLTGCEAAEMRRAWDLLAAPELAREDDWHAARAGQPPIPGLGAVRLMIELKLEDLFADESKDIGSEAPDVLPPSPNEPGMGPGARLAGGAGSLLVKGLLGVTGMLPRTARAPTWVNALENWAQDKLSGLTKDLERQRHRELHRLAELFASNPDEALRHAIPLSSLAHRGRGAPSGSLGRRSLDFNLGRLGGGGAADFWDVPADLQQTLAQRYREMAMLELKRRQYRRAACILAELLGDLAGAADALKQGKFFREAALLYEKKLHNPLAAAACYAEGGLIAEALALYEAHGRWLDAADLHAKLGDREAERAAVRRMVEQHQASGDTIAAACLLETRLDAPSEALALLAATWPHGKNALVCLEERFELLARRRDPEESCELITFLAGENPPPHVHVPLIELLATRFEKSAEVRVRHAAAEAVRVKAAGCLPGHRLDRADEMAVLKSLTRLAPEDRLLARDAQRFRELRPKSTPPPVPPRVPAGQLRRIELVAAGSISLPRVGPWVRVCADSAGFYAVATAPKPKPTIFLSRGSWRDGIQSADWADPAPERGPAFFLASHPASVFLGRPFAPRLEQRTLPTTDAFRTLPCVIGTPAWLPEDTVQVAVSRFGVWAVRVVGARIVLANFNVGQLVDSRDVTEELQHAGATGGGTSLALAALHQGVALGYGQHLLGYGLETQVKVVDLGARVIGIVPIHGAVNGWVALLERGAAFVSRDLATVSQFDDSLELPQAAYLGGETLVLIGGEEGIVAQVEPTTVRRVAHFTLKDGAGIGLTPAMDSRQFAVFTADGSVRRWKFTL